MAKLFVSYSRKDSTAARKLIESFRSIEQDVWVDWESIPPAVDWLEQIFRGIEEADAFVFLVSPDSIASEVCKVEIGRAVQNNKRIIPIVLRDVNPRDALESIRKLNWTFIREADNFEEGLAKIRTAIELDLDWLEEHRRLQVRALEWHRRKDVSLLLRGRDLRNAQHMLQTYTSKDPIPTELQRKYIDHSVRTERNRTIAWIATGLVVVAMAILSYLAVQQSKLATKNADVARQNAIIANQNAEVAHKNEVTARRAQVEAEKERAKALEQERIAREQRKIAEAQRSTARAQIYQTRTGELYTSTLLALDSWEKSPSTEAEELLRQNINLLPHPVAQSSQNGNFIALELSPTGTTFLAATDQGTVCVRNLRDAKELFCETVSTSLSDALFVRGGKSIATADSSGLVQIRNAENGAVEREIDAGSSVRDLDIGPRGTELAIARENGNITILNIENQKDKGYPLKLTGTLTVADLSPDGRWYAAGSATGSITVWNLNGKEIYSGGRHKGAVLSIRFSPNSRFVISGGADNYADGIDTRTGEEIFHLLHSDPVADIAFAPTGSWFATASNDARVRVWDLSTAQERLILFQDNAITAVNISSDGRWIAATGEDNTVRMWSAYSGVEIYQIPLEASGSALIFSDDDQRLVSGDFDGNIAIWDISEIIVPTNYIQFDELARISKFAPSGNELIASAANRVWLLNPQTSSATGSRAPETLHNFDNDIQDLVVSPSSELIGISTVENEAIIYSLQTFIPRRVEPSGSIAAIGFSSDSSRFITVTTDGIVETWDVKTRNRISSLDVGDSILSLAASSQAIALGAVDKIMLLDANAEQKLMEWDSPGENQFVEFNRDGSLLVSANSSGQIEIWKIQDGTSEWQKTITREQPFSMAFDPRSNLFAVGTGSNAYVFDASTGDEVSRIAHKGIVYSVSFAPNGQTLATASLKLVQLWDVTKLQKSGTEDLVQAACSRLITNFSHSEWQVMFGSEQPYVQLCQSLPIPE